MIYHEGITIDQEHVTEGQDRNVGADFVLFFCYFYLHVIS